MRQLAVENHWSQDEYQMASELISEPGPYGLHASMFLVRPHYFFLECFKY